MTVGYRVADLSLMRMLRDPEYLLWLSTDTVSPLRFGLLTQLPTRYSNGEERNDYVEAYGGSYSRQPIAFMPTDISPAGAAIANTGPVTFNGLPAGDYPFGGVFDGVTGDLLAYCPLGGDTTVRDDSAQLRFDSEAIHIDLSLTDAEETGVMYAEGAAVALLSQFISAPGDPWPAVTNHAVALMLVEDGTDIWVESDLVPVAFLHSISMGGAITYTHGLAISFTGLPAGHTAVEVGVLADVDWLGMQIPETPLAIGVLPAPIPVVSGAVTLPAQFLQFRAR